MIEKLLSNFSKEVLSSKSVALVVVAFLVALAIAAVGYFLFSFNEAQTAESGKTIFILFGRVPIPLQVLVFSLFILSFVVIWFLLSSQYTIEAEDIYSRLREKLVGKWAVQYELEPGQRITDSYRQLPMVICAIEINPVKKLEIHHEMKGNPLFADGKQVIQTIALHHEVENKYSMSYYYKADRLLSPLISNKLIADKDDRQVTEIEIEVFATLIFEDVRSEKTVKELSGKWLYLNDILIRIYA